MKQECKIICCMKQNEHQEKKSTEMDEHVENDQVIFI